MTDFLEKNTSKKSKAEIEPYYIIYKNHLSKHGEIFNNNNTFID